MMLCTTSWLTGTIPVDINPVLAALSVIGLDIEILSFAQIHSD